MKDKLEAMGHNVKEITVSTFHALGLRILREWKLVSSDVTILSGLSQEKLLKMAIQLHLQAKNTMEEERVPVEDEVLGESFKEKASEEVLLILLKKALDRGSKPDDLAGDAKEVG